MATPALCLEKEGDLSEIQKGDCLRIEFLAMIQINRILFRFFWTYENVTKTIFKKIVSKKIKLKKV